MLKINGGKNRGRKILLPKEYEFRPTKDIAKAAIFNHLQFEIEGKIFLDLFSGSGAIALEAESRGAGKIVAVENNFKNIQIIKKNLEHFQINKVDVIKDDALNYLAKNNNMNFDFIFIDPPYGEYELINQCLELIIKNNILNKWGKIIIETNDVKQIKIPENLMILKDKKFGRTILLILTNVI